MVEISDDLIFCQCGNMAWVIRYQKGKPPVLGCRVCYAKEQVTPERLERHLTAIEQLKTFK